MFSGFLLLAGISRSCRPGVVPGIRQQPFLRVDYVAREHYWMLMTVRQVVLGAPTEGPAFPVPVERDQSELLNVRCAPCSCLPP